jgi:hypothetical protein
MQSYSFRMNYGSFVRICFMDKLLKIGLIFMVAAVVLMPAAILPKDGHRSLTMGLLVFTMLLELIGLVFVILSIIKRRKG